MKKISPEIVEVVKTLYKQTLNNIRVNSNLKIVSILKDKYNISLSSMVIGKWAKKYEWDKEITRETILTKEEDKNLTVEEKDLKIQSISNLTQKDIFEEMNKLFSKSAKHINEILDNGIPIQDAYKFKFLTDNIKYSADKIASILNLENSQTKTDNKIIEIEVKYGD